MAKTPILRLIPSGAKLSEIADTLDVVILLVSTLLSSVIAEHPHIRDQMIRDLRDIQSLKHLTAKRKTTYEMAIRILEQIVLLK
jgi:hypothetical protein